MKEKRHPSPVGTPHPRGSDLPVDYLRLVTGVFDQGFAESLGEFQKHHPDGHFGVTGTVYPDEIVLSVTLHHGLLEKKQTRATTVHVSADFDPTASSPTAEELLAHCVDAAGAIFSELLPADRPETIAQVAEGSLSDLDQIPLNWTEFEMSRKKIYLRVDQSNPVVEALTDQWLEENDPESSQNDQKTLQESEEFFEDRVENTKKGPAGSSGSHGPLH